MNKKELIILRGHKCEECENTLWRGKPIPLEIHHICPPSEKERDLQLLCPNCHTMTPNYRGKGIDFGKPTISSVADDDLKMAVEKCNNIRQVLIKLNLVAKGANYDAIRKRIVNLKIEKNFNKIKFSECICLNCGFFLPTRQDSKFCSLKCSNKYNGKNKQRKTKINWPDLKTLFDLVNGSNFTKVGKQLGVSDNAIRKRLKKYIV